MAMVFPSVAIAVPTVDVVNVGPLFFANVFAW